MEATLIDMGEQKKGDKHKPRKMVGIPVSLAKALEELADEQFNKLTDQVKIAIREYLERHGRLPKPGGRQE